MKTKIKILLSMLSIVLVACTSDSENDLIPDNENKGEENELTTYEGSIKAIINSNCLGCHSNPTRNGAPFSLTTFSDVNSKASAILAALQKQTSENAAMPPSGRLPQTKIDLVQKWIDDGQLEK